MTKPGERVGAILGGNKETGIEFLGFGVYEGDFVYGDTESDPVGWVPDMVRSLPEDQRPRNPRIRLDSGEVVWGIECWWGPEGKVCKQLEGKKVVYVSITEVRQRYREAMGQDAGRDE
jgi:hypothetical protein